MEEFSKRIKEQRIEKNKTQKELAEILNISTRQYQNYELGKNNPSIDTLIRLANYYNLTIDYLVGREQKKEKI